MINRKPKELAPTLLVDGLIFLSAYFPLFAILLIQDFRPKAAIPENSFQALLLRQFPVFMLDSGLYLHAIAIVLFGLFAFNYQSWQSITSLLVFLLFMFAFVRRDRVTLLNPIFLLLGIRLYRVSYQEIGTPHKREGRMLCLGELVPSKERLYLQSP